MKTDNENELRELDAWIAEHIFGDKPIEGKSVPFSSEQYCHPHHSTDPAAAMQVLEKCAEKVSNGIAVGKLKGNWCVTSHAWSSGPFAEAPTLPLAICLFAQKLFSK